MADMPTIDEVLLSMQTTIDGLEILKTNYHAMEKELAKYKNEVVSLQTRLAICVQDNTRLRSMPFHE